MELTPIGKLFFGGLLAWITKDAQFHFKIKGTPEQVQAMANAVFASKRFHDTITNDPSATIEKVIEELNKKNKTAKEFASTVGNDWPL
jgi:hypothetical protein